MYMLCLYYLKNNIFCSSKGYMKTLGSLKLFKDSLKITRIEHTPQIIILCLDIS